MIGSFKNRRLKKKRILFLRRTTVFGGSEIVILDLLKAIDYERHEVFLASPENVFSKLIADLQLPVTYLPLTARFTGGFVRMFISWIRFFSRVAPDKIILAEGAFREFPPSAALAAFVIARGDVWIMALHPAPELNNENSREHFGLLPRLRERAKASASRGILSISEGIKDRLVRCYGYAPGKISVVYCGVDTKRFSPASRDARTELRRGLQIPLEAVVVVSSARLDAIKRLDRLIRAFGAVSREHKDLWLLLTGDGPLRHELENLVLTNNSKNIKFLGYVDDVGAILRASDIYVLPSDEEGFGIALIEAMACELICVATKTVGPSEIVEDGRSGLLVELTYEGVLKGLEQALTFSHNERIAIGKRARQRVIEHFRVEVAAAKGLAFMQIIQTRPRHSEFLFPKQSS
jgi:glycosyltransferase involved in cell wall biosynthesis